MANFYGWGVGVGFITWTQPVSALDADQLGLLLTSSNANNGVRVRVQWAADDLNWTYDAVRAPRAIAAGVAEATPAITELAIAADGSPSLFLLPVAARWFRIGVYATVASTGIVYVDVERLRFGRGLTETPAVDSSNHFFAWQNIV